MLFFRKKPRKIEAFKLTKQIRNLRFSKIKRINQLKSYQFCLKTNGGMLIAIFKIGKFSSLS